MDEINRFNSSRISEYFGRGNSKRVTYFTDGQPLATAISVLYKEFETGASDGSGYVISKSEYIS